MLSGCFLAIASTLKTSWRDNIKMDLKEDVNWIHLPQNMVQLQATVNT